MVKKIEKEKKEVFKSDFGTKEFRRHKGLEIIKGYDGIKRSYIKKRSALHTYLTRKVISNEQYEAGDMLFSCYYSGIVSQFPKITASYEAVRTFSSSDNDPHRRTLDSRQKYYNALKELDKMESKTVRHVCCDEKSLNKLYTKHMVPYGKKVLCEALDKLCKHFGLPVNY